MSNHYKLSSQRRENIKEGMNILTLYRAILILCSIMEGNSTSGYGCYGMEDSYGGIDKVTLGHHRRNTLLKTLINLFT